MEDCKAAAKKLCGSGNYLICISRCFIEVLCVFLDCFKEVLMVEFFKVVGAVVSFGIQKYMFLTSQTPTRHKFLLSW